MGHAHIHVIPHHKSDDRDARSGIPWMMYEGSLARLERDPGAWSRLRRKVAETVKVMPLWRLQTVGSERLEFLYENLGRGSVIRLEPGVAYCFRGFYCSGTCRRGGASTAAARSEAAATSITSSREASLH